MTVKQSIVLVGVPDSGKTNFIARLWITLQSRKGRLVAPSVPADISYVEDAIAYLSQGEFAPRSAQTIGKARRDFIAGVRFVDAAPGDPVFDLVVPDVTGELWKSAVETYEIPKVWMEELDRSIGALLFVRVQSELNVQPADWVATKTALKAAAPPPTLSKQLPTQVVLCELLRFLELSLKSREIGRKPRVAVVITAWDRLDIARQQAGLLAYLKKEFPMFAGRILDTEVVDVSVFGTSVVGGDFDDNGFKNDFLNNSELKSAGYCVYSDGREQDQDLSAPVSWILGH